MKLVSAESQISWNDSERMQVQHRAPAVHRYVGYDWAFSDSESRKVIAARIAMIVHARKIPDTLDGLKVLDGFAVRLLSINKSEECRNAAAAARRVGGLAPYLASLVYRAIRLGEDSVQLATELRVHPGAIRQALNRLNWTAQHLAAGTLSLPKAQTYARLNGGKRGFPPRWDFRVATKLRSAGFSCKEIAAKFGVCEATIRKGFWNMGLSSSVVLTRWGRHKFNYFEALALRREGLTYRELAERFGVHPHTIANLCTKSSIFSAEIAKGLYRRKRLDPKRIAELRAAGWTYAAIAKELGAKDDSSVFLSLQRAGLWVRKNRRAGKLTPAPAQPLRAA